jgi:hypothetical protein
MGNTNLSATLSPLDKFKIGFLTRLFGRRYTGNRYVLPLIFQSQMQKLDVETHNFGESFIICNISPDVIELFKPLSDLDNVWTRHNCNLITGEGLNKFMRINVSCEVMPLIIHLETINPVLNILYRLHASEFVMTCFIVYGDMIVRPIEPSECEYLEILCRTNKLYAHTAQAQRS